MSDGRMRREGDVFARPIVAMVTDRRRYGEDDELACDEVVKAAGRAAIAGMDLIQVRERGLDDRALMRLAERIRAVPSPKATRTLINDRIDVAIAARADGVHLPARAITAARVRAIVPGGFLIGRSVHSEAEAREADREGGADFLIFGTVFESVSKPPGHPVAGIHALARVCANARLPVLAIGGITVARIPEIARAGAAGVAAIGLFASAEEAELNEIVQSIRRAFELNRADRDDLEAR